MSDGWGDASGIEGNYEEEDNQDDSSETNEVSETVETSSSTETTESNSTNRTNKTKTNIKDEWNGRTIYIPDDILDKMEDTYLESQLKLRKAGQDEFKKNRHFYPLLVRFGVEALSNTDAEEIQARLANIGDSNTSDN